MSREKIDDYLETAEGLPAIIEHSKHAIDEELGRLAALSAGCSYRLPMRQHLVAMKAMLDLIGDGLRRKTDVIGGSNTIVISPSSLPSSWGEDRQGRYWYPWECVYAPVAYPYLILDDPRDENGLLHELVHHWGYDHPKDDPENKRPDDLAYTIGDLGERPHSYMPYLRDRFEKWYGSGCCQEGN